MTPPLPDWIRTHHLHGYTNVFSLLPDETRLFGTEDLYGDWNGRVLLLAKDFACSQFVRDRIQDGDPRPYRHEPRLRTNIRLRPHAEQLRVGPGSLDCGILYGSALACLLRDDGRMSGTLPSRAGALSFGTRVVGFVVKRMPRLRAIVCLGNEAWQCTLGALACHGDWRTHRDSGLVMDTGHISLIAACHPAARVSREKASHPWTAVHDVLSTAAGIASAPLGAVV